ncbi:cardiolipin synthase [Rubritalea halochordaticola]|uniref:Cardiolipin synthase n=2 Tax=Rubritalea halochordaticola TaxID=714537 RepID=A0ABP9V0A9_9BACT
MTVSKVVVRGHAVSILRNPVTTTSKGVSMVKSRFQIAADPLLSQIEMDEVYRNSHSIEDALTKIGMPEPIPGKVEYLIDGKAFFNDLERTVKGAKRSVDTRVFIYDNDDVAVWYSDLLRSKGDKVRCRVLMDELGSIASWWTPPATKMDHGFKSPESMYRYLTEGNKVEVRESKNPFLVTDHSKLFIVDQEVAYLGGMNVGREYRYEWHDMMVKVRGPVVTALQNDFDRAWILQGGWGDWQLPFHDYHSFRVYPRGGEYPIRILKTDAKSAQIRSAILAAIRMSKKRVYIQNSYFTADGLVRELKDALARGVDVRMVFPEENDSKLLDKGNRDVAKQLIDAGAKVYMYPEFTHVKAVVVDDWACVGSANYDGLSMRINEEINISYSNRRAVDALVSQLFYKDFRVSKRVTPQMTQGWNNPILESVVDQL